MLTAVIKGPTFSSAKQQMKKALPYADAFEFRLDYFSSIDLEEVRKLKNSAKVPVLFTLRKNQQGGAFSKKEESRLHKLEELASLRPDFIDLEYDIPLGFFQKIREKFPEVQIIVSYHNFEETPQDLFILLQEMEKPFFGVYKIACLANRPSDFLRMLHFVKKASQTRKIIGISMGEYGKPSRVLGPIVGNFLNYASIEKDGSVLHQISLQELHEIYHFRDLNADTKIYALLGDPVEQSVGHLFHNRIFQTRKQNAVYVKCKVAKGEAEEFFKELQNLPFQGFSVTMPLKEEVVPLLHDIDSDARKIEAVNTIFKKKECWSGTNTDARGALDALEEVQNVRRKKLVILGTGGTAKSIAFEAVKRNAEVYIVSRIKEKAEKLAFSLGCHALNIQELTHYDILINATPVGMEGEEMPLSENLIFPGKIIMDTIYRPVNTPLLKAAEKLGCTCIYGYRMFENQALLQQKIWQDI